jgi:hypothetical protein
MDTIHLTIIKQLAAKLTSFGFPNDPKGVVEAAHDFELAKRASVDVTHQDKLSENVSVYRVGGITGGPVFALVVFKPHNPQFAAHVVDFRVGNNIYA